ncbi:hypothetical protein C9374_003804 [Naegleria lovaniensis]|uniref:RGS domain-containing protein n=1 Tax=Naegleria lovaniensis TaxID=51637 RepID=A0AA88GZX4_NAELO|nr:uncharacterized protein C9374_003804 [Naegleria lovaniensis]KAG2394040.1 hypothetical protein C9374_003804 [Naegleria lovaniensis]
MSSTAAEHHALSAAATQINSSPSIPLLTSFHHHHNNTKMESELTITESSSSSHISQTINHPNISTPTITASNHDDFTIGSMENNSFGQHVISFNDLSEVSSVGGETDSIDELTNLETSTLNFSSPSPRLSDSSMSLLLQFNQYGIIKQYNRLECISHRVLPMPCHFSKCKIMKRDPSGGCAVFIVRYRESLDDDHEFAKREIDLDVKDLFDSTQNDYYDTTSGKVIINRQQQNTIQRKDLVEDLSNWIERTNPLYEQDNIDACFMNPLFYEKQPLTPQQVMFYHTCHYEEGGENSSEHDTSGDEQCCLNDEHVSSLENPLSMNRNPYMKHLESVTPNEEWIEIVNPISLYGLVRTEAADRAFGRVLKTKISKLRSSSVIFTANATPSAQKRKDTLSKKRKSIARKQSNRSSGSISSDSVNNAISIQTSNEWQQSLLHEEFNIHVSLETEYEEFCNPLFEHETHNVLLPDGFKHSDLISFMNQMKTECPPTTNKLIYNRCNIYEKPDISDVRSRLNRILSIRHQRTVSSSGSNTGSKSDLFDRESRQDSFNRRFSEYSLDDRRDEDIGSIINVEKQKLTVYGSQLFDYISKKAQLYFTPADVHMFLNYLIDTQRRSCDGVNRDLTSNIVLLNPVPYDPQQLIEFSPQNIYRYSDDDNPVFYNDQIINIIPLKKTNSMISEHELMSKLFHKGAVPKDATYSTEFSEGSVFLLDFPNYTIKLLIALENLMTLIQKDYIILTEKVIDYNTYLQSEHFKLTVKYTSLLRHFDPLKLDQNQKKTFFINLHNLMLMHSFCSKRYLPTEEECMKFLNQPNYLVGRYKLSMNDISQYILRNEPLPEWKFYLNEYRVNFLEDQHSIDSKSQRFDPRIHFVLCDGKRGSPLPVAVDQINYERIIDQAVRRFVNDDINITNDTIEMSDLFRKYRSDFSPHNSSLFGVLNFIYKFLRKNKQQEFIELLNQSNISEEQVETYATITHQQEYQFPPLQFQIIYKPIDYTSNCRIFGDFIDSENSKPITFDEILRNQSYRSYFRAYAEIECSTENIEFYEHVEKYKTITDVEERWKFAKKIFDKFLVTDSPSEVNVNKKLISTARRQIFRTKDEQDTFVKLPLDLFDRLNKEVEMVLFDTFCRFTNTDSYQQLVINSRRERKTLLSSAVLISRTNRHSDATAAGATTNTTNTNSSNSNSALDSLLMTTSISTTLNNTYSIHSNHSPTTTTTSGTSSPNSSFDSGSYSPTTAFSTSFQTSSHHHRHSSSSTGPPITERRVSKISLLAALFEGSNTPNHSSSLVAAAAPVNTVSSPTSSTSPRVAMTLSPRLQNLVEIFEEQSSSSTSMTSHHDGIGTPPKRKLSTSNTSDLLLSKNKQ